MAREYPQDRASRRPRVIRNCKTCGKEFSAKPSNVEVGGGIFCSKACMFAGRKTRSDKKPRLQFVCQWCGKVFVDERHSYADRKYCSNRCLGLSQRKGKNQHPRKDVSSELKYWARAVILRDKACIRCGATDRLQAHHIKTWKDDPLAGLDIENGATLCAVCHHSQHPYLSLDSFLNRPGRTVVRCVVCEKEYLPWKKTQRTCSPKCGHRLRRLKD